jgi:hypothetical protein
MHPTRPRVQAAVLEIDPVRLWFPTQSVRAIITASKKLGSFLNVYPAGRAESFGHVFREACSRLSGSLIVRMRASEPMLDCFGLCRALPV